ncbi:DUF1801 domain-containing protein [Myroides guanonis]|uniref:YdhG-like domain-containing protein n=1 Tax=Myroides guanonis TaxID=1150112 RepID=A0A1I3Q6Q3_9FLAO|nr:DUF1801 domain-containing protein [Myroides guanonis]SFJ29077.1 protein of unknown function (DU1801) [Myroides guanonis]
MAKNKTEETQEDVFNFIENFCNNEQKRKDALDLVEFMKKITGFKPRMWGSSIIGFGHYHYKYASGHEGDAPLIGFSPRKTAISLYVFTGLEEHNHLLEGLGKFKKGKACIYVNKLSDIDEAVLEKLIRTTIDYLHKVYS